MSLYGSVTLSGKPDLENVRRLDLLPIPMIVRMERYGIAIDPGYLLRFSAELGEEMAALAKDIASYVPTPQLDRFVELSGEIEEEEGAPEINPSSALAIRALLYETLHVGRTRELRRTPKGQLSTDKKQLELLRGDHPVVPKILEYRQRSKLKSAFADSLPLKAQYHPAGPSCPVCELAHAESTHRVHTRFLTTRAETGRLASRNPNLQQIPVRSDLGGRIRRSFLASPGTKLVSVDFSQIELRDLAHLANAKSMIQIYRDGKDIHMATACETFDRDYDHYFALSKLKESGQKLLPEEKADWNEFALHCRLPSKNTNFMIVYGATARGLQAQLSLSGLVWSEDQCEDFIQRWFDLYPEVKDYIELQHYRAKRYGYVWDPFGRVRRVPEVHSTLGYIREQGLRQAMNMPIQSCSAGQTKLVMGELDEVFDGLYRENDVWVWPLLTIHDQLIVEVDQLLAPVICQTMIDAFREVMHDRTTRVTLWRTPIESDGEILARWSKED